MYTTLAATYAQRKVQRDAAARARERKNKQAKQETAQEHADAIMLAYEEAYAAAHGRQAPRIEYSRGWYVRYPTAAYSNMREADMTRQTQAMWAAVHARELGGDDE